MELKPAESNGVSRNGFVPFNLGGGFRFLKPQVKMDKNLLLKDSLSLIGYFQNIYLVNNMSQEGK